MSLLPRTRPRRLVLALAGIGLAGSLLTGCAGTPALNAETAGELQNGVLAVSTAAAAGDFATAQTDLGTVQATLDAAVAGDTVTATRASEIQAAIDLVGADLAASIAAGTPVETPEEAPVEEPDETATPEPVATPDEDVDEEDVEQTDVPLVTDTPKTEKPAKPGKDKTETGACEKKDKCD